uniref:Uncharacterized protein n=1 Tax=Wuchereria bancrofti TaxID=6293 RepID=A0AAF5PG42_WUCBA
MKNFTRIVQYYLCMRNKKIDFTLLFRFYATKSKMSNLQVKYILHDKTGIDTMLNHVRILPILTHHIPVKPSEFWYNCNIDRNVPILYPIIRNSNVILTSDNAFMIPQDAYIILNLLRLMYPLLAPILIYATSAKIWFNVQRCIFCGRTGAILKKQLLITPPNDQQINNVKSIMIASICLI